MVAMGIRLGGFLVAGTILTSLFMPRSVLAAPTITGVQTNQASLPKYEKFEVTFQVQNSTATNTFFPFDTAPPAGLPMSTGISVNGVFTDPQGNVFTQPGFYYQDFQDLVKNNNEWFYPLNTFSWKVRFTPNTVGTWQFRLSAQDSSGTVQTTNQSFTVTSSSSHGFIKVSPTDKRYFEYGDGTYFPALGFNLNGGQLDNFNPVIGNTPEFQSMNQNGIQLSRVWISQFSIYGEAYGKWGSYNRVHMTQEPRYGIVNPTNSQFSTNYPSLVPPIPPPGSEYYLWLEHNTTVSPDGTQQRFTPCRILEHIPVKQNTNYRIKVLYTTSGIEGPLVNGQPYGFAVKRGTAFSEVQPDACNDPAKGTVLAMAPSPNSSGWTTLEGTFSSGATDFLSYLYLTFNNVKDTNGDSVAGHVFIDRVWLEEASCTSNCPNLISKPWMSMHEYINQRDAYSFDKLLDLSKQYGIYLKAVMNEKNDRIFQTIDFAGQPVADPSVNNFYGNHLIVTKVRWLQQAWWRYMQARWGYSPNIQSWELLNEGHGGNAEGHWDMASEFGKFMKCRVFGQQTVTDPILGNVCLYHHPNSHLTSTSFFGGAFPWQFWNNGGSANAYKLYRDVDYADQHLYAHESGSEHSPGFFDSALYTLELSSINNFTPSTLKPYMRGEVAWVFDSTNLFEINSDKGVWLHDFIWGGINPGGLMEHFFAGGNFTRQIYSLTTRTTVFPPENITVVIPPYDHRPMFKPFYDFIKNVPLDNGQYTDASATASLNTIRAWGQKDLLNKRAHLWISNERHIWCAMVPDANPGTTAIESVTGCPETRWSTLTSTQKRLSGTVTVTGFVANTNYLIEWWQFDENSNLIGTPTTSVTSNASGAIVLNLDQLPATVVDEGVKIGSYTSGPTPTPVPPTLQQLLLNWLTSTFDQNSDGIVNSLDFAALLP